MSNLTTTAELRAQPLDTVVTDCDGDRWRLEADGWHIKRADRWSAAAFSSSRLANFAPLTIVARSS